MFNKSWYILGRTQDYGDGDLFSWTGVDRDVIEVSVRNFLKRWILTLKGKMRSDCCSDWSKKVIAPMGKEGKGWENSRSQCQWVKQLSRLHDHSVLFYLKKNVGVAAAKCRRIYCSSCTHISNSFLQSDNDVVQLFTYLVRDCKHPKMHCTLSQPLWCHMRQCWYLDIWYIRWIKTYHLHTKT